MAEIKPLRIGTTIPITEFESTDTIPVAHIPARVATIMAVLDDGGGVLATGIKVRMVIDFACTIQGITMVADQTGSAVVDLWKDSYASYPPTDADSITASAPPTISSAIKSQDNTLTGWTVTVNAGDTLIWHVDSCSSITQICCALKVLKT